MKLSCTMPSSAKQNLPSLREALPGEGYVMSGVLPAAIRDERLQAPRGTAAKVRI